MGDDRDDGSGRASPRSGDAFPAPRRRGREKLRGIQAQVRRKAKVVVVLLFPTTKKC